MSAITDGLTAYGAEIIRHKVTARGESVVFAATPAVMQAMRIGNAQAWQRLIEDNDPQDEGRLYVRLDNRRTGGEVRVLTPEQVNATKDWPA